MAIEDPDFGRLVPCSCRLQRFEAGRYGRLTRFSNLGRLSQATFDAIIPPNDESGGQFTLATQTALAFAEDPDGWITITGPGASGKTQLAAAIANHQLSLGNPVFFTQVADLLDHLRSAYEPNSETPYDEMFEQVRNVPLLVLDDLGHQASTPWAQEKLAQLLGHRANSRLPTVVTTDLPFEQLDERLRGRLEDPSLARVISLGYRKSRDNQQIDSLDLETLVHMTFETFNPSGLNMSGPMAANLKDAHKLAQSFADQPEGWLVFVGGNGCGKTHLATAIAHQRRKAGDDVLFAFVPDLLDQLRSTFQSDGRTTYDILNRIKRVGLLILDDFSEPVETGWTKEKLYQILNHRYAGQFPTVITSGLEPEQLEPRIWSRMSDARLSNVYEIRAPDYRTGRIHRPRTEANTDRPRNRGRGRNASTQP